MGHFYAKGQDKLLNHDSYLYYANIFSWGIKFDKQRFRAILFAYGYDKKLQADLTYDLSSYVFKAQQVVLKELSNPTELNYYVIKLAKV